MDPVRNPYSSGAGTPLLELAGRDDLRETGGIAVERVRLGQPTKSVQMVGLRGVGKQEWGKHAWDAADASPITLQDVEWASEAAIAALDESFFRVRFDRLTPFEKRYLRAMAELGPGPHRSGEVADVLTREVTSLAPTRSQLIAKGMIWSPSHGDTAFTVPLFDEFMRRIIPSDDWKS